MAVPAKDFTLGRLSDGSYRGSPKKAFFPALFRGEEVSADIKEILGHSVKRGVLGIPDPRLLAQCAYNTSKSASEILVGSLLGGTNLNYVARIGGIFRASDDRWKHWEFSDKAALTIQKALVDRAGLNSFRRAMENGAWLRTIPRHLNRTELSREKFQNNLLFQYCVVPLNLPTDCDGCGKNLLVPHDLLFHKGVLVLAQHNDATK